MAHAAGTPGGGITAPPGATATPPPAPPAGGGHGGAPAAAHTTTTTAHTARPTSWRPSMIQGIIGGVALILLIAFVGWLSWDGTKETPPAPPAGGGHGATTTTTTAVTSPQSTTTQPQGGHPTFVNNFQPIIQMGAGGDTQRVNLPPGSGAWGQFCSANPGACPTPVPAVP